jgi:hypothetical protein
MSQHFPSSLVYRHPSHIYVFARIEIRACDTPYDLAISACTSPRSSLSRASRRWNSDSFDGLPSLTPRAFARFKPSPVRARISSLSNLAKPASTVSIKLGGT